MSIRQDFPVVCPGRCLEVKFAVGIAVVQYAGDLPFCHRLAALALTTMAGRHIKLRRVCLWIEVYCVGQEDQSLVWFSS
jgi:hypothetical protein